MKKIICLFLLFFISSLLFSRAFDFTVGGSYRLAFSYFYDYSSGFYELFSVPVSFSYYPGERNFVSFGVRNKLGYGLVIHETSKVFLCKDANVFVWYNTAPLEHEVYENISFILKLGARQIKYIQGVGFSLKYSFLNVPATNIGVVEDEERKHYEFSFIIISPNTYHLFTLGPSIDFNLEILNEDKNFSFIVGLPVEFLFPTNKPVFKYGEAADDWATSKKINYSTVEKFYFNLVIGLEFTFSFNIYREIK